MNNPRNDSPVDNRMNVRQAVRHALLLGGATLAGGFVLSGPAIAQDEAVAPEDDEQIEEIVTTGSRLARSGFDSPTPMDVVNVREAVELGYADLNEVLVATPALAASDQMTDVLSGILGNVNGGQGVATIDLRGLGAGRTLSLLNGRRAGPAGVRDGVTSFDVNVIPVAALERVEILKDGASSIYGSDAIGGVVNYITRKDTGGEVNAYTQMAEESGGEIYQVNASYGREYDRGYWRVTADYNKQEQILKGQREIFECEQEYIFNEPGLETRADVTDPRTGDYKCYGGSWDAGSQWIYRYSQWTYYYYDEHNTTFDNTRVAYDYDGSIAASGLLTDRNNGADSPADLRVPEGWFILPSGALGEIFRPNIGDFVDEQPIISDRERITLFANGEFEINDSTTLYAEVLFNRRETTHEDYDQLWTYNYTENYGLQLFDGSCFGYACWGYDYDDDGELIYSYDYTYYYVDVGGGDPQSVGWTGAHLLDPVIAYPAGGAATEVDYTRLVVGATGEFGESNWSWDASYQFSRSDGMYLDNIVYDDARWASMNKMPYWGGSHIGSCEGTTFDRYGPDVEFVTVNGAHIPTGTIREADIPCIDINALDPRVVAGDLTDEERDFLYGQEMGTTVYDNQSFDLGFANNKLFSMPAGEFGLAAGLQYVTDEIADTPGIESRSGNAWDGQTVGRGSAKILGTYGQTDTTAAYVETRVPLLAGKPGFDYLELNASARWTEVSIDATPAVDPALADNPARDFSDTTYKIGLDWRVNDVLRFRANRGTSFRTPALFELYRQNFHQFPNANIDPCRMWGESLEENQITQKVADNCAAEGIPDDIFSTIGPDVTVSGGAATLDPETSVSNTIGVVFTAREADFQMSIDYWHIEVEDEIDRFSAEGILDGCYESDTYPTDQLCSLFTRDQSGNPIENWRVDSVQSKYINSDLQRTSGWDIEADYVMELPDGMALTIRTAHTITTKKETESSTTGEITSRKGWAGNPEWVGNLTFRLDKGPWAVTWRTTYIDSTDNWRPGEDRSDSWIGLSGEDETYYYKLTLDSRLYHNASVNYSWGEGWVANLSINNVADELPPRASERSGIRVQGYGAFHSQYDWKGRRYGLNIKKVF